MRRDTRAQFGLHMPHARTAAVVFGWLTIMSLAVWPAISAQAVAPTFVVNSVADVVAAAPLDSGPCETAPGNGVCTLRAAVMKANHYPGGGATIRFGLPGVVTYTLTIPVAVGDDETTGNLNIANSMTIIGNGPGNTIIDGNGTVTSDSIFFVHVGPTVNISGVTIKNGRALFRGGGIDNSGTLTLDNCTVIDNQTSGRSQTGGGIFNGGSMTLVRSTVSGNKTTGIDSSLGGGIYASGPLQIIDSTIANNIASSTGSNVGGGGLRASSDVTIVNSAVSGNRSQYGGGIFKLGGPLTMINSTVSGNFSNVDGGGIYSGRATIRLFNATITDNRANGDGVGSGDGGGIYSTPDSTINFINSIIALNGTLVVSGQSLLLVDNECLGTLNSQGNNIMYANTPAQCVVNGAVTFANPLLGPLQDNSGFSKTHALLPGSPAIGAGNPGGCTDNLGATLTTDQRGAPRPSPAGGNCDIGAFEVAPFPSLDIDNSITATKYNAPTDGVLAIRAMFGLTGSALTTGALGGSATRTDPAAVKDYLDRIRTALDIDGNGKVDALTDGMLIIRYLAGLRGNALVAGVVDPMATRKTALDIEAYLQTLVP